MTQPRWASTKLAEDGWIYAMAPGVPLGDGGGDATAEGLTELAVDTCGPQALAANANKATPIQRRGCPISLNPETAAGTT